MFQSISWQQYFLIIITLLIFYYLIIGIRYFKWEILSVLGMKKIETSSLNNVLGVNLNSDSYNYPSEHFGSFPTTETEVSPMMQSLNDEISAFLNGEQNDRPGKQEIMNSLKIIFSKYPLLSEENFSDHQKKIVLEKINNQYPGLCEFEDLNKLCSG